MKRAGKGPCKPPTAGRNREMLLEFLDGAAIGDLVDKHKISRVTVSNIVFREARRACLLSPWPYIRFYTSFYRIADVLAAKNDIISAIRDHENGTEWITKASIRNRIKRERYGEMP